MFVVYALYSITYDKIYVGIVGDSTVTVSGLKKGKYAIYVTGFDSSSFNKRVSYPLLYEFYYDSSTVFKKLYMNPICCTF